MSKYAYGTLYLVRPDVDEDSEEHVVDAIDRVSSGIDVAKELWQIAGNPSRSLAIKRAIDDGFDAEGCLIKTETIEELLRLTDGLEAAVRAGVPLDDEGKVSAEKLAELRASTKTLWLDESRGDAAPYGVREGVYAVHRLREVLVRAKQQGLYIAFD